MRTLKATALLGFVSILLTFVPGCAWVRQSATLELNPRIEPSTLGAKATVAVRVVDRRASPVLGHRGLDSKNASITTKQDVPDLFQQKLIEGLTQKGFVAVKDEGQPFPLLTVEIRRIDYTTDMDYWKGLINAQAELLATTVRGGVKLEQVYVGERKETSIEAPGAKTNERLINGAMSDAVQRLFEDQRLLGFLAE
jgi:uncharacterized lipoprotein YajG